MEAKGGVSDKKHRSERNRAIFIVDLIFIKIDGKFHKSAS